MRINNNESYLELIKEVDNKYKGLYKCKICLGTIETYNKRVLEKHTKTCGCKSGKKVMNVNILVNGKILSDGGYDLTSKMASGYLGCQGKYVHRMVAEKYIPNPLGFTDVNHIDGNKENNSVENLEWCTRSHNLKHAWDNNLNNGARNLISKKRTLSEQEVTTIYKSELGCVYMAREIGVSKQTILAIRNNKIYKNITSVLD